MSRVERRWGWEALRSCSGCSELRHPTEFHTQRSPGNPAKAGADGLKRECKYCAGERARLHRLANLERARARDREVDAKRRATKTRWKDRPENKDKDRAATRRRYAENGGLEKGRRYIASTTPEQRAAWHRGRSFASSMRNGGATAEDMRYAVMLRHDPCCYCGKASGTVDHITPVSVGGGSHWTNLTAACAFCNTSKHNRGLLLWLVRR